MYWCWLSLSRMPINWIWFLLAADNLCQIRIRWKQSKSETYITRSDAWQWHCCLSPFATDHTYDHDWKWITAITDLTESANWWLASKSNITWTLITVWEYKSKDISMPSAHSSGAVWESRWPSWAVRPNEPSGFRGRKDLLNHASALVSVCP